MGQQYLTQLDYERALGGNVLRDVSRSFFLSLRLLPPELRGVCSLGYLLARTSDTLADTAAVDLGLRKSLLNRFRELIRLESPPDEEKEAFFREVERGILPHLTHRGELTLMRKIPDILGWLCAILPEYRASIDKVLDAITKGQAADLDRFGEAEPGKVRFIDNREDLVLYADQVAGSVGRFWTEVGKLTLVNFARASLESMCERGERYGRALQYINIVRDLGEDVRSGRCYLPRQQLEYAGWGEGPWNTNQGALMNVALSWLDEAEDGLRAGLDYAQKLRNRRVKLATVLPAMLGAATIRSLRKSQSSFLTQKVKIDRSETRKISLGATQRVLFKRNLEPYFNQLLKSA